MALRRRAPSKIGGRVHSVTEKLKRASDRKEEKPGRGGGAEVTVIMTAFQKMRVGLQCKEKEERSSLT